MELKLIDGSLHIYKDGILIIKTKGNPTKNNQPFTSLEEAILWHNTTIPESIPEPLEEPIPELGGALNETVN